MLACLSRRRSRVQIPSRALNDCGVVRKRVKRPSSNLGDLRVRLPPAPLEQHATIGHWQAQLAVTQPSHADLQVQLLLVALNHGSFVYRHRTLAPQAGKAGSIPARATEQHDHVAQLADARRSERRAARHGSSTLPVVTERIAGAAGAQLAPIRPVRPVRYRGLQLRVGGGSTGFHKPGPLGATPRPAMTGYANWHSGEVESLVPVGSTPTLVTTTIPWSNGKDAWVTTRKVLVRFQPGSFWRAVCRCFGSTPPR